MSKLHIKPLIGDSALSNIGFVIAKKIEIAKEINDNNNTNEKGNDCDESLPL